MLNPDKKTIEWAAQWIEDSLKAETNERTIEFGKNMAMTLRAVALPSADLVRPAEVGHVLLTPQTCPCDKQSDLPCNVCDGGLAICAKCGKGEVELNGPCAPTEADDPFTKMASPSYPATCDICGVEGTNESMAMGVHVCDTQPAEEVDWDNETIKHLETRLARYETGDCSNCGRAIRPPHCCHCEGCDGCREENESPAEVDVRAVVETWTAELADPISYDIDATGPIPKPVAVPGVDIETLINRLTVHMGQPATERARQVAEEIIQRLHPSSLDHSALEDVLAIITKHSASRGDGGMSAAIEKVKAMRDEWKTKRNALNPLSLKRKRYDAAFCAANHIITALEERERGGAK